LGGDTLIEHAKKDTASAGKIIRKACGRKVQLSSKFVQNVSRVTMGLAGKTGRDEPERKSNHNKHRKKKGETEREKRKGSLRFD